MAKAQLQVSGSNEVLTLVPESQASGDATSLSGKSVLVEGTIPEATKGQDARFDSLSVNDRKNHRNEYSNHASETTFGGAQLFFPVHIPEHFALLCASFLACAIRVGSISRIDALILALVSNTLAAQAVDVQHIRRPDRV